MKHVPIENLRPVAAVSSAPALSRANIRRNRLGHFAALLEAHEGSVSLFNQLEYLSETEVKALRSDHSPLAVAFADPTFRAQGLANDEYQAAIEFFDLNPTEAHHLLCACHYLSRHPPGHLVAKRARKLARRSEVTLFWRGIGQKIYAAFAG